MKEKTNLLGERLIDCRMRKGITQTKLAMTVHITKSMLSKYENGRNIPKANILGKIAQELNVSCDYLLGYSDNNDFNNFSQNSDMDDLDIQF